MADKELVAKGEDWARAQRERLEQAANEKATQLRRIYNEHLEWFKTHTIESLIETRRPVKRHKTHDNTAFTPTDQVKLVQSSRHTIPEDSSMEGNSMRSFSRQSMTSRSFHSPTTYRSFSLTSPTANRTSSRSSTSKSILSPTRIHQDASRATRRSTNSFDTTSDKKTQRISLTSTKGKHAIQRQSISKETSTPTTTTHESSASKPTTSTNESSSEKPTTTTKESSAVKPTAANESSSAKPTTTNESSSVTPSNKSSTTTPTKTSEHDNSQMSPQHNGQPNNDKADANNKEVASHVDPDFQLDETPSWAEMPELERHLRQQCNMDGHKIFGRMTPLVTSEVFGSLRQRQAKK
ncbi:hypothetical protein LRAMOSA09721 [Lichtheimia ramosa]|uniref:Inner centromere protein ARK-binding domain-containing protein n=1 Tax=Lichtheimia ramosa TaxID=688394 RepID=A0A077WJF9_9FUNG|nr:hypothetical protein LRAMOSA09721 [Lichtheimia ramosa]